MATPTRKSPSTSRSAASLPAEPSAGDKALAFDEIFRILFVEDDETINGQKEWDQSSIEQIGDIVRRTRSPE